MIFLIFLLCPFVVRAEQHGAHSHEAGELNFTVSGKTLDLEIEVPSPAIYGFEHVAKTEKEKKVRDAAMKKLEDILSLVKIEDPTCKAEIVKMDAFVPEGDDDHHEHKGKMKGQHGDVKGQFKITCNKPLTGQKVSFSFSKVFPELKLLKIQVVDGKNSNGAEIKNDKESLIL